MLTHCSLRDVTNHDVRRRLRIDHEEIMACLGANFIRPVHTAWDFTMIIWLILWSNGAWDPPAGEFFFTRMLWEKFWWFGFSREDEWNLKKPLARTVTVIKWSLMNMNSPATYWRQITPHFNSVTLIGLRGMWISTHFKFHLCICTLSSSIYQTHGLTAYLYAIIHEASISSAAFAPLTTMLWISRRTIICIQENYVESIVI